MRAFACIQAVVVAAFADIALPQPEPDWAVQFGTPATDIAEAAAPDGAGGAFVAATTWGSLGGPLVAGSDAVLMRCGPDGARAWTTQFGTDADETARGLAPDGLGGVFVTGFTSGSLGGTSAGGIDAFLARFDGAGQDLWVIQFGTAADDHAHAAEADGAGGVYIAGTTYGDLAGPNAGQRDAILVRLDGDGNRLWAVQFGSAQHDVAVALAPDGSGGAYIAGRTGGDLGGPRAGKYDAFLARYDETGNLLWITQYGTSQADGIFALASDGAGGVWAAGETYGDLAAPNAGIADIFIAHHDASGQRTFVEQFGSPALDFPTAIAPDGLGGAFLAGDTDGDLFAPSAGTTDTFILHLDDSGTTDWTAQFGTEFSDGAARTIAPDSTGSVILPGETLGDLASPSEGGWDIFLIRYNTPCAADCNGDHLLDLFDFLCFVSAFNAEDAHTDCDGSGGLDLFDFLCFADQFGAGC